MSHNISNCAIMFLVAHYNIHEGIFLARAARSGGSGELDSSIAKDLNDSEDPNIRCFVTKLHLSRFTRFLGMIFPSFDSNSNRFVNH